MEVDRRKLTPDQVAQLDQYQADQDQLQAIKNLGDVLEHLTIAVTEGNDQGQAATDQFGPLLVHIKETLDALKTKEDPQLPDYAKPVVDALSSLETSLKEAIAGIDTKPEVSLPAPVVNVDGPKIDLSKVASALKTDIPAAFEAAIKLVPPAPDNQPLVDELGKLGRLLEEVRDRPIPLPSMPSNVGLRSDGLVVSTTNPLPTTATFSGTVTTAPTFKDDPTLSGETPKYGKTNSTTHKQMVESASSVVDGANIALGATTDSVASSDTGTFSLTALFKRSLQRLTSILSTQTDGTQKTIVRGGAKGSTAAADVTSTSFGANNQQLDVAASQRSTQVSMSSGFSNTVDVAVNHANNAALIYVTYPFRKNKNLTWDEQFSADAFDTDSQFGGGAGANLVLVHDPSQAGNKYARLKGDTKGLKVKDDYQAGEILADQAGAAAVLTFTFANAVDFIWVTDVGTVTTNVSRVDMLGGTPSATLGVPVFNQAQTPISVTPARTTIKVYAPVGTTISMYGHRRTA